MIWLIVHIVISNQCFIDLKGKIENKKEIQRFAFQRERMRKKKSFAKISCENKNNGLKSNAYVENH